jgi:hypothetical protein
VIDDNEFADDREGGNDDDNGDEAANIDFSDLSAMVNAITRLSIACL